MSYHDYDGPTDFAQPSELLAFCNKVRQAGGAKALSALLPGVPEDTRMCLIAKNLNFECAVSPAGHLVDDRPRAFTWPNGHQQWFMFIDDEATRRRVAAELNLELVDTHDTTYKYDERVWEITQTVEAILLPQRIGAAAEAFDSGHPDLLKYAVVNEVYLPDEEYPDDLPGAP